MATRLVGSPRWHMRRVLQMAAMLLVSASIAHAQAPLLTFTEYPLGLGARTDITAGPDGALWFTDLFEWGVIGRITTAGVVTYFPLPDGNQYPDGKFPMRMTVGPDGAVWFTETKASKIGRISVTGVIDEFPLPAADREPFGIATGPDGALWYTESSGGIGRIGRITTQGVVAEYETPCEGSCLSYPTGIVAGPDGALWFTDLGSQRIVRITTDGLMTQSDPFVTLPGDIIAGPDNALWFTGVDTAGPHDHIGRITTAGDLTAFPLPIYPRPTYNGYNNLEPSSITTGPDGALWFTSGRVNAIGRITTDGVVTMYRLPGGTIDDDFEVFRSITTGPDGALWITNRHSIVRAVLSGSVTVDVKPGSCNNPLNPKSKGVLPVAVLGTADLDVSKIDVSSIMLEGVPALRASVEDVAAPPDMTSEESCSSPSLDGYGDLALKFSTQSIVAALASSPNGGATRVVRLTGLLKPEFGGTPIHGQDIVLLTGRSTVPQDGRQPLVSSR